MASLRATTEHWLKGLAWVGWLAGAVLGVIFADRLSLEAKVLLAIVWLVLLAVLLRHGLVRLFGPVLFFELLRLTRRPSTRWLRNGYAVILGICFAYTYVVWANEYLWSGAPMPLHAQAELAHDFFLVYMAVQFGMMALLTPGFVAGAIAEEKERKTLEFILATDLRNREIVFGKLAARVGNITLLLLAGLPVLSFVQFFGGVDPNQLLAGFAATLITMLSLAALSIACSVMARRARDAILLTYLLALVYLGLSLLAIPFQELDDAKESVSLFGRTVSAGDVAYAFSIGNPIVGLIELDGVSQPDPQAILRVLGHLALLQNVFIVCCLFWSVRRVRTVALRQGNARGSLKAIADEIRWRSPLRDDPMFWKEVYVEPGLRLNSVGRVLMFVVITAAFSLALEIVYNYFEKPWSSGFTEDMNRWACSFGTIVFSLFMLAIALRGAGSFRSEIDRQTFDGLLMTPLSSKAILWGKWWGCMLGLRKGWLCLGAIWLVGAVSSGISFIQMPFLLVMTVIFGSTFAWIGIWSSLTAATSLRATMKALLFSLFAAGGYMLLFLFCCMLPVKMFGPGGSRIERDLSAMRNLCLGMSPSYDMAWMLNDEKYPSENEVPFGYFVIWCVVLWAGLSFVLSKAALARFKQQFRPTIRREPGASATSRSPEARG